MYLLFENAPFLGWMVSTDIFIYALAAGIFLSCLSVNNSNENELNTMTDHNVILLKLAIILFAPVGNLYKKTFLI